MFQDPETMLGTVRANLAERRARSEQWRLAKLARRRWVRDLPALLDVESGDRPTSR